MVLLGWVKRKRQVWSSRGANKKLDPHPESVPINKFVKIAGTPVKENEDFDSFELVRMIATARIVLPLSEIRLSAGRKEMSEETQAMCFMAGASSIFTGEKLLTADNPGINNDLSLLDKLGLKARHSEAKFDLSSAINVKADGAVGYRINTEDGMNKGLQYLEEKSRELLFDLKKKAS